MRAGQGGLQNFSTPRAELGRSQIMLKRTELDEANPHYGKWKGGNRIESGEQ